MKKIIEKLNNIVFKETDINSDKTATSSASPKELLTKFKPLITSLL